MLDISNIYHDPKLYNTTQGIKLFGSKNNFSPLTFMFIYCLKYGSVYYSLATVDTLTRQCLNCAGQRIVTFVWWSINTADICILWLLIDRWETSNGWCPGYLEGRIYRQTIHMSIGSMWHLWLREGNLNLAWTSL